MNFNQKRQKFANEQRRKHREEIFKKHRTNYMNQQNKNQSQTKQLQNQQQFIFQNQFNAIIHNSNDFQLKVKDGTIEKILNCMPQWIASLGTKSNLQIQSTYLNNKREQIFLHNVLNLYKFCIRNNYLLTPTSNCLVELTGLPKQYLKSKMISEEYLVQQFMPIVYKILQESVNMQVIINCVYICGNLYESYANLNYLKLSILHKMAQICSQYPNYENCLQITLWFIRNCLLVNQTKNQKNKTKTKINKNFIKQSYAQNLNTKPDMDKQNFQCECFILINKIIIELCIKIEASQNPNNIIYQDVEKLKYYHYLIYSAFKNIFIVIQNEQFLNIYIQNQQNYCSIGSIKNVSNVSILNLIDKCIRVYISAQTKSITNKFYKNTIQIISQLLQQILLYLESVSNKKLEIPGSILQICILTAEGKLKYSQSMQLCCKFLEFNGKISTKQDKQFILIAFFNNVKQILEDKTIITDRDYRVSTLKFIDHLFNHLSCVEVAKIIQKIQQKNWHQNKCHNNLIEQQIKNFSNKIIKNTKELENKFESYMFQNFVHQILNILQLLLIDEDNENRVMGLKIILKLTTNWQLNAYTLRNCIMSMGINNRIIEMQEEPEQTIYNCALDIIEELKLDEENYQI